MTQAPSPIKAAFFDIDGTLVSFNTHCVSDGTIAAFEQLHARGIRTFLSTGRPRMIIPAMPLHFDGAITMNGGLVYCGNEILYKHPIAQEDIAHWMDIVAREEMSTMLFGADGMCMNKANETTLFMQKTLMFPLPELKSIEEMARYETYQIIAIMPPERDEEMKEQFPGCRFPRWSPTFTDVVAKGISKANGIDAICQHLGITPKETIGFGDGGNDKEMIERCGIGVAMGNAVDNVKACANFVTRSVDEEGIAYALQTLGIIE